MSLDIARLTRGATFRRRLTLPADSGTYSDLTSQARRGNVVTELAVRAISGTPFVEISATAEQTAGWPLGLMPVSLRLTVGAEVAHTETIYIHVLPEVTQ